MNCTELFIELYPKFCPLLPDPRLHPVVHLLHRWLAPTDVSWLLETIPWSGHSGILRTFQPNRLIAARNFYDGDQGCYLCERATLVIDWDRDRVSFHVGPNNDIHEEHSLWR